MRTSRRCRTLGAALVAAGFLAVAWTGPAHARGARHSNAGRWKNSEDYRTTTLGNLRRTPKSYLDSRISFLAYFASRGTIYRPYYTRFNQDLYANIYVWPGGAQLWERDVRGNVFTFLYISRSNKRLTTMIEDLDKYQTIRIYGHVTSAHDGRPWIDIHNIDVLHGERNYSDKALKHIEIGVRSIKTGDYDLAARNLEKALRYELPPKAEGAVNRELGMALYPTGKFEKAQAALKIAVEGDPARGIPGNREDSGLRLRLGQSILQQAIRTGARADQLNSALEHLNAAVDLEPGDVNALASRGLCFGYLKQWEDAIRDCNDARRLRDNHDRSMRNLGVIYRLQGRIDEAIEQYQRAILQVASEPLYHKELALIYLEDKKDYAAAEGEFSNVILLDSENPEGYVLRAKARVLQNNDEGALEDCKESLAQDRDYKPAHSYIALVYMRLKRPDKAEEHIKSLERLGNEKSTHMARAKFYLSVGKFGKAADALNDVLKIQPNDTATDTEAYYELGLALAKKKPADLGGAIQALEVIVTRVPNRTDARYHVAGYYLDQGVFGKARAHLIAILRSEAKHIAALLRLAYTYTELGKDSAAVKQYEAALAIDENNAEAKHGLALIRSRKNLKDPEALRLAREASEAEPKTLQYLATYAYIAFVQEALTLRKARAALRKADSAMPDSPWIQYYRLVLALHPQGLDIPEAQKRLRAAHKKLETMRTKQPARAKQSRNVRFLVSSLARANKDLRRLEKQQGYQREPEEGKAKE